MFFSFLFSKKKKKIYDGKEKTTIYPWGILHRNRKWMLDVRMSPFTRFFVRLCSKSVCQSRGAKNLPLFVRRCGLNKYYRIHIVTTFRGDKLRRQHKWIFFNDYLISKNQFLLITL